MAMTKDEAIKQVNRYIQDALQNQADILEAERKAEGKKPLTFLQWKSSTDMFITQMEKRRDLLKLGKTAPEECVNFCSERVKYTTGMAKAAKEKFEPAKQTPVVESTGKPEGQTFAGMAWENKFTIAVTTVAIAGAIAATVATGGLAAPIFLAIGYLLTSSSAPTATKGADQTRSKENSSVNMTSAASTKEAPVVGAKLSDIQRGHDNLVARQAKPAPEKVENTDNRPKM